MGREKHSTDQVIALVNEQVDKIGRILDAWIGPYRMLPERAGQAVLPVLGDIKAMDAQAILRIDVDRLKEHLESAAWYLREIGGEIAGIQYEYRANNAGSFTA